MAMDIHAIAVQQMSCNFTVWRDTKTIDTTHLNNQVINDALKIITDTADKYFNNVLFDWANIVEWPVGAKQQFHLDTASDKTVLSSITYLNNDFRGGETLFEDGTKIAPVPGRTVFFDGIKYKHAVYPVTVASRFTLPIWYKDKQL